MPASVKGTILILDRDSYSFNLETNQIVKTISPAKFLQPTFLCKYEGDTLIISSQNPTDRLDGLNGFFKVSPKEMSFTRIEELGDDTGIPVELDYNESNKSFLFKGRINEGATNIYLLDSSFKVTSNLSYINHQFGKTIRHSLSYFCDTNSLLIVRDVDKTPHIFRHSVSGSQINEIGVGWLQAMSHSRKMVVVTIGRREEEVNKLVFLEDNKTVNLPPLTLFGCCFSPDDTFIACLHQTYNLGNTVELYIYDIKENKIYLTKHKGWGSLVWIEN